MLISISFLLGNFLAVIYIYRPIVRNITRILYYQKRIVVNANHPLMVSLVIETGKNEISAWFL